MRYGANAALNLAFQDDEHHTSSASVSALGWRGTGFARKTASSALRDERVVCEGRVR